MSAKDLLSLTLEFKADTPDGLRIVTQAGSTLRCLVCSRSSLPGCLGDEKTFSFFDVPGVYLLIGPAGKSEEGILGHDRQLYIGQGDSVADRLESHLKSEDKQWWTTVAVISQHEKSLNLTECKYLESRLYSLASGTNKCVVHNKVSPQLPAISPGEKKTVEDFLEKALVILSAFEWDFFRLQIQAPVQATKAVSEPSAPPVPARLAPLLEAIQKACEGASFARAKWYSTRTDYRAKYEGDSQFRVFLRVKIAKNWFRLELADDDQVWHKIRTSADLKALKEKIEKAYKKAELSLQDAK